jgi:quinol monooxygenase YgiN
MPRVTLTGLLVCKDENESSIVHRFLAMHLSSTRAEVGCISFGVAQTSDPLVWQVDEEFADTAAFEAHQRRVSTSEWGRATQGIERRYRIEGRQRHDS